MRYETVINVTRLLYSATLPFVQFGRSTAAARFQFRQHQRSIQPSLGELAAVSAAKLTVLFEPEVGGINIFKNLEIALVPSLEQCAIETHCPSDTAFLESV